jgi:hypothetical protein
LRQPFVIQHSVPARTFQPEPAGMTEYHLVASNRATKAADFHRCIVELEGMMH